MKKLSILLVFILCVCSLAHSQQAATTFILVRHAERANDGTNDPDISDLGKKRGVALAQLLKKTTIDAIYSTPFKRTRNTVAQLAADKNLTVQQYEAMKGEEMDQLLEKHKGGTIVLCGHSNTTPWIVNYFLGKEEYKNFDDADYNNLIILDVVKKGDVKITWLNFGDVSPK